MPGVARVTFGSGLLRHVVAPPAAAPGCRVREVLARVFAESPHARARVLDERGALQRQVVAFVDGAEVGDRTGLTDAVRPDGEIHVMPALSGGADEDADPVLDRVVEQASELLHVQRVGLAVIEPDDSGPVLRFVAARGLSNKFSDRVRPRHWRDGTTPRAIHERRPVWSADVLNDPTLDLTPGTRRGIEAEGYHAVLSVPLLVRDHALGALVLYRDEPGPFTPEVVELAQVFAAQAAVAIENSRLCRRAEDRATKLHTLSGLTQLIVSAAASGEVVRAVAEASTQLLGARVARVWIDVPELRTLRIEANHGADASEQIAFAVGTEAPYGEGIAGTVHASRRPLYGRDLQADPHRSQRLLALQNELHAFAALPLVTGDRAVGVLILIFAERRDFTAEERELMHLLADQAAIAIHQSQLYREGDRRRQEAEVMAELASKINASLELDEVLARVVEGARDLCRADFSRIAVRTPTIPPCASATGSAPARHGKA